MIFVDGIETEITEEEIPTVIEDKEDKENEK